LFVKNRNDNDANRCTAILFQTIIGLEIHAQLDIASATLNCQINTISRFERKLYIRGFTSWIYQIIQQRWPIGYLKCRHFVQQDKNITTFFTVGIHRIQIEQDTGKTILAPNQQLIDLNRAGCSLIEIVFLPNIRSAHQAVSAGVTL